MGTHRSVSCRAGDVVGNSFFSGAVTLSNSIGDSRMVAIVDAQKTLISYANISSGYMK
jgi:hypothetical protein